MEGIAEREGRRSVKEGVGRGRDIEVHLAVIASASSPRSPATPKSSLYISPKTVTTTREASTLKQHRCNDRTLPSKDQSCGI